jgi:hypothetical protein
MWGGKTLPKELGTCKYTQEAHRNTLHHLDSLEFTEFGIGHKKGGKGELTAQRNGERDRDLELNAGESHQRGGQVWAQGRRRIAAGEGRSPAR